MWLGIRQSIRRHANASSSGSWPPLDIFFSLYGAPLPPQLAYFYRYVDDRTFREIFVLLFLSRFVEHNFLSWEDVWHQFYWRFLISKLLKEGQTVCILKPYGLSECLYIDADSVWPVGSGTEETAVGFHHCYRMRKQIEKRTLFTVAIPVILGKVTCIIIFLEHRW